MSIVQDLRYGVAGRVRAARRVFTRTAPGPLFVRGAVAFTGAAALVTAYPGELAFGPGGGVLVLVALLPALLPRGRAGTILALIALLGWLMSTTLYREPVTPWRLIALASLLYLGHTLTALAAVLPYDAVVAPEALAGWAVRGLAVVAGSAAVSMGLLVATGAAGDTAGGRGYLAASLVGLALATALVALLPWLHRRHSEEP